MAIVIGAVVILVCTTILGGVALALVVGWYKYIVFMNDNEKVGEIQYFYGLKQGWAESRIGSSEAAEFWCHATFQLPVFGGFVSAELCQDISAVFFTPNFPHF